MSKNRKGSRKTVLHLTFPSQINGTKIQTVVALLRTAWATVPFRLVTAISTVAVTPLAAICSAALVVLTLRKSSAFKKHYQQTNRKTHISEPWDGAYYIRDRSKMS